MTEYQDYFDSEESDEEHVVTRHYNFECDTQGPHLGCEMGIDVQV